MDALTPDQQLAKVLFLEQENAKLRASVLDYQVRLGIVKLEPKEAATDG